VISVDRVETDPPEARARNLNSPSLP
jgi:hypothetical protein